MARERRRCRLVAVESVTVALAEDWLSGLVVSDLRVVDFLNLFDVPTNALFLAVARWVTDLPS